jgi:hypothetical protein
MIDRICGSVNAQHALNNLDGLLTPEDPAIRVVNGEVLHLSLWHDCSWK